MAGRGLVSHGPSCHFFPQSAAKLRRRGRKSQQFGPFPQVVLRHGRLPDLGPSLRIYEGSGRSLPPVGKSGAHRGKVVVDERGGCPLGGGLRPGGRGLRLPAAAYGRVGGAYVPPRGAYVFWRRPTSPRGGPTSFGGGLRPGGRGLRPPAGGLRLLGETYGRPRGPTSSWGNLRPGGRGLRPPAGGLRLSAAAYVRVGGAYGRPRGAYVFSAAAYVRVGGAYGRPRGAYVFLAATYVRVGGAYGRPRGPTSSGETYISPNGRAGRRR